MLEMAWYCFEKRRHDDVILEYLACHYNGLSVPMYQLLSAASSGHTALYDLPERLLGQMLFDGTFSHLDRVFRCYIQGRSVDESLVKAYLAVKSSRYFEGNEPYDSDVLNYIEAQTEKSDIRRSVPEICMLALTKYYSMADRLSKKQAGALPAAGGRALQEKDHIRLFQILKPLHPASRRASGKDRHRIPRKKGSAHLDP